MKWEGEPNQSKDQTSEEQGLRLDQSGSSHEEGAREGVRRGQCRKRWLRLILEQIWSTHACFFTRWSGKSEVEGTLETDPPHLLYNAETTRKPTFFKPSKNGISLFVRLS